MKNKAENITNGCRIPVFIFLIITYYLQDFFLPQVGDHQSLLQSVKNSADYESFMDKANIWENKLANLDHHLSAMAQIQKK